MNFDYKMSTRILYVRTKYSMYDLICDDMWRYQLLCLKLRCG